jgi:hypothetical protein
MRANRERMWMWMGMDRAARVDCGSVGMLRA